jgi:hypothetical protein
VLAVLDKYDWFHLEPYDLKDLRNVFIEYHAALQNVAAVGRTFIGKDETDSNAKLSWIPGLWRLAGQWVSGTETFRSSLSFEDFSIYLVNERLKTLASISVADKTQRELMVWLEEHIINLNLSSSHLTLELPYALPERVTRMKDERFSSLSLKTANTTGGYLHDSFIIFSMIKENHAQHRGIFVNPETFHMELKLILKKTDEEITDTYIKIGFCPGDDDYDEPYFYVTSWPFIANERLISLKTRGFWHHEDWLGAVYFVRNLWDSNDQLDTALYFFNETIDFFQKRLLS